MIQIIIATYVCAADSKLMDFTVKSNAKYWLVWNLYRENALSYIANWEVGHGQ